MDYALHYNSIKSDHFFINSNLNDLVLLLKLHGSINWGKCKECKRINAFPMNVAKLGLGPGVESVRLDLGSRINTLKCCNKPIEGHPVIVPPTWNKTLFHKQISNIWKKTADVLRKAENIFIIGYSFPVTDEFFRYLFA